MMNVMFRIVGVLLLLTALVYWAVARPTLFSFAEMEVPTVVAGADSERLKEHVEFLVAGFDGRSYEQPEHLNAVADFIAEQLVSSGGRVSRQWFTLPAGRFQNVVAEFGPEDGAVLVVGAHYDTAGSLPGADDNASGVAGLLELGRLLGERKLQQKIVLVGFTLEEPPFFATEAMGSAVYADGLKRDGVDVELMISLEMIGYFNDAPDSQDYSVPLMRLAYPTTGNFIAVVDHLWSDEARALRDTFRASTTLPAYAIHAPEFMEGVHFSDHRNFWFNDYPAVMVTDTAYLRNHAYHTSQDTPDRLNYQHMAQVVDGVLAHLLVRSQ